jgi:hypothetical protein
VRSLERGPSTARRPAPPRTRNHAALELDRILERGYNLSDMKDFLDYIRMMDDQATELLQDTLRDVWDDLRTWWNG